MLHIPAGEKTVSIPVPSTKTKTKSNTSTYPGVHPADWPTFLRPCCRKIDVKQTVNSNWGLALKEKQIRAKTFLWNVYGLRVTVTIGERTAKKSINRIKTCITSHTGIMGITSHQTTEGEVICISTQTQAAIIGVWNNKQVPKTLINFLKEKNRVWIVDKMWCSPLRKLIGEERIVEWKMLSSKARDCKKVTDLLKVIGWPRLRIPDETEKIWESVSPSKEQVK